MNTIIAYKENGGISFVSSGNGYYGNIQLDTKISGLRVFENGLVVGMEISPDMECMLEILDRELGGDEVELNEDYLKDTFIPTLHEILDDLNMLEDDGDTKVDSLSGRMLIAKGATLYLINFDFDFWYVPDMVAIGVENNVINMIINNYRGSINNKDDMKELIRLAFKYRKESMDSFYYLNTLDLKEVEF